MSFCDLLSVYVPRSLCFVVVVSFLLALVFIVPHFLNFVVVVVCVVVIVLVDDHDLHFILPKNKNIIINNTIDGLPEKHKVHEAGAHVIHSAKLLNYKHT